MAVDVYDRDVGTVIQLDTGVDLTNATQVAIFAKSPLGTIQELTASIVEGTTKIKHVKTADTLNMPGVWQLQAYVKFADGSEYRGDIVQLVVGKAIK